MTAALTLPIVATVPLARYRLVARWQDDVVLPDYAGSLLRGQWGAALRAMACMTHQRTCGGCPLQSTCHYSRIFEAPALAVHSLQKFSHTPCPYVIEPPLMTEPTRRSAGDLLQFGMVLAGHALDRLPLILLAWQAALARGLTSVRSRSELCRVDWMDEQGTAHPVWQRDVPQLADHPAALTLPVHVPVGLQSITLQIDTPLRLQHQGQPLLADQLSPRTLLAALARRIALVMELHAGQPHWGQSVPDVVRLAEGLQDHRELHWHDWHRYSSRQQQAMTLGGVIGRWTLIADTNVLATLWPWLWLGQWLHVGKNASMGMGAYTLAVSSGTGAA